jgi:peptidoglycan hydrolase FlgJ
VNPLSLNTILTPASGKADAPKDPKKIAEAATQFESMLIEQMLKSSREAGSGDWSGCGEDQTSSTTCELAEQQFAQLLASKGGFGVAKLVIAGLEKK